MRNTPSHPAPVTWVVTLRQGTPDSQGRLAELLRPNLERTLAAAPETREATYETPFGTLSLHRQGSSSPGAPIRLTFAANHMPRPEAGTAGQADGLPLLTLPDATIQNHGACLIGLEELHQSVLYHFNVRWDGALEAWSQRTGQAIPPGLHRSVTGTPALFIFAGDPGTGKSVSAATLADRYCRQQDITGHLVRLGTELRGDGTVNSGGNRLQASFAQLGRLPDADLKMLVLEEAEAIGMRRSEGQSHFEDRAQTSTLLQCLDAYGGRRRFVVVMTTNVADALDAAIIRRAVPVTFARPNQHARCILLADWLPDVPAEALDWAAEVSEGMTGSDMVRTLMGLFTTAVQTAQAVPQEQVLEALFSAPRTGRV